MSEVPVIEVRNVTVIYNKDTINEVVALKDTSVSISKGEMIVIKGGNGSGKSTLLKAIAGTAPVISGQIFINGNDVTKMPAYKRSRLIGSVHQDPMLGTCPNLTVHENLQISQQKSWHSLLPERFEIKENQLQLIRKTGIELDSKSATPMTMLSGGQRQIITLCLALSSNRPILFLDEFTASLDEHVKLIALEMVVKTVRESKKTVMVISHDISRLKEDYCRTIRVENCSVVQDDI
jgi:putative tryptophan/tyrosine transport system ATP-binding protein